MFGLEKKHLKVIREIVLASLEAVGAKVWIFGSRARGDYKQFSDLDLLVSGEVSPSLISIIREKLEDSSLPIKVDLVCEKDLADSYRENVDRDKISLSEKTLGQ